MDAPLPTPIARPSAPRIASWIVAAALMFIILRAGLMGTFIAGFAVYTCVHALAPLLPRRVDNAMARQVSLGLLAVAVAGALTGLGMWMADLLQGNNMAAGLIPLMSKMGEIITQLREILPEWMTRAWPSSAIALNAWVGQYLTENAATVQSYGQGALKALTHVLLGMVLGGLVAIAQEAGRAPSGALSVELQARLLNMLTVFRQVVVAQVKISLLNTFFTAIFLLVVLPLTGHPLPFAKTMVLITFVAGLIPVLGNLISNTVITVIALSVSLWVAVAALLFLVVIHKVEYFLNAKIVGSQINARAWELLSAMLVMEACFGLPGVIAAPIFYAYIKRELRAQGWVGSKVEGELPVVSPAAPGSATPAP